VLQVERPVEAEGGLDQFHLAHRLFAEQFNEARVWDGTGT